MKFTKIYTGILFLIVAMAACKKSDSPDNSPTTIDPSDAKTLSLNIKVNHGQSVEGNIPVQSGNDLKLNPSSVNKTSYAIAGKYAVIRPELSEGVIAGYYLRIVGNNQNYFKIDFSKPISGRKKTVLSHRPRLSLSKKVMDDDPGYADSVIIIRLPENIKPGTFCVEYAAYNMDGSVSNMIKECVTITALGGDKNLIGKWESYRLKYNNDDWEYYPLYDWLITKEYKCVNNKLNTIDNYDSSDVIVNVNSLGYRYDYIYLSFADNNVITEESNEVKLTINKDASSCSNFKYDTSLNKQFIDTYFWSLDSVSKKMIFIWEKNVLGDLEFNEFDFKYIDKDHFELYLKEEDNQEPDGFYDYWEEFVRK